MTSTLDREHIIVSGLFGTDYDAVYPAIPGQRSVFFTDREDLRKHIGEMGWECFLWNADNQSTDLLQTSLKSKWVKFLQFLDAFEEFRAYRSITYVDHKFFLKAEHIQWIMLNRDGRKDILIRETPALKETLTSEIEAALGQERYERHMAETKAYLDGLISNGSISENVRIVNTGLIHYMNPAAARVLTNSVFEACNQLAQPECQILWAALSQMRLARVQRVAWDELSPIWVAPFYSSVETMDDAAVYPVSVGIHGAFESFENDLITDQIRSFGAHTRNELAFVLDQIRLGDHCVDLGAHIGTYAIPMAQKAGPSGRVLAVEGDAGSHALLERNLKRNGLQKTALAIEAVLGDGLSSGFMRRNIDGNTGAGFFEPAPSTDASDNSICPLSAMDILVQYRMAKPDFIKIDVEGMEHIVLQDLIPILEKSLPALYIEIAANQLQRHGSSPADIQALLRRLGYRFYRNTGERNSTSDNYSPAEIADLEVVDGLFDILALPKCRQPATFPDANPIN